MNSTAKKLLDEALCLPEEERASLVDALNESLQIAKADLSPEWQAEIARRIDAVERGESHLVAGDEVDARVRETLRGI